MRNLGDSIFENFKALDEEEKEACIHCGALWYRIHHRDGVCHQCQTLGREGATAMAARRKNIRNLAGILLLIALIYLVFFAF